MGIVYRSGSCGVCYWAGSIEHCKGSRDLTQLSHLRCKPSAPS